MPSDWLFYWMTLPAGLALIGLAIAIPFAIWRLVLASAYSTIGYKPLAVAYACAFVGLAVMSFVSCYLEFSSRVAQGMLSEAERWSIVPGWTIYLAVLSLIIVLPLAGFVGTPLTAYLLKERRLNYTSIAIVTFAFWLLLSVLMWVIPGNEWHRIHRVESFVMSLKELFPGVTLIALPFLFGVYSSSHPYRYAGT